MDEESEFHQPLAPSHHLALTASALMRLNAEVQQPVAKAEPAGPQIFINVQSELFPKPRS